MDWFMFGCLVIVSTILCLAVKEIERLKKEHKKAFHEAIDEVHLYTNKFESMSDSVKTIKKMGEQREVFLRTLKKCHEAEIEELKEQLSTQRLEILCGEEDLRVSVARERFSRIQLRAYRKSVAELTKQFRIDLHKFQINHADEPNE